MQSRFFFYSMGSGQPGVERVLWTALLSGALGVAVWVYSFLALWKWFSFFALAVVLAPFAAVPAALIGFCVKSQWSEALAIVLGLGVTSAIRSYGVWLAGQASRSSGSHGSKTPPRGQTTIVEAEVIETRENDKFFPSNQTERGS